jgi:hypothetical protein
MWDLAFPSKPFENESALGDIFAVAAARKRAALSKLLVERLTADPLRIPDYYRLWYSLPWRKIYTLNVDNLDLAVATRFQLPRRLMPVSAVPDSPRTIDARGIDEVRIVHLNGCLAEGLDLITFSPPQYGRRHSEEDPAYAELAADLLVSNDIGN